MENIKSDFDSAQKNQEVSQKTMDFVDDEKAAQADYSRQLDPGISKELDGTFEANRGNIPLAFLRAFAWNNRRDKSKGFNPAQSSGGAAGLFGISSAALNSYNSVKGQNNPVNSLADANFNTKVAVYLLQKIVAYYAANYPKTMIENWNNPDYVALIVHGYNVGHAEPKGLGAAIKKFNDAPDKLTFNAVTQVAKEIGLSNNSYNTAWMSFAKGVANTYLNSSRSPSQPGPSQTYSAAKKGTGGVGLAAIAGLIGLGVFLKGKR
jgi:hypothetical protein